MFKSLYDRILSVKFLNTVLIGCAVMGGACSLSSCLDYGKGYVQCSHTPYLLKCGVLHRLFSLGFCQNLVVDKRNQLHTFFL